MKLILIFTFLLFALTSSFGQNLTCKLTDSPLDYKLISYMDLGEMEYFEDFDNDSETGLRYRLIIERFETHESLYIEKIVVDVEGIPNRIDWCKRISISSLLENWKLEKEYTSIDLIEWKNYNRFEFKLNGKYFSAKIINAENIEIVFIN